MRPSRRAAAPFTTNYGGNDKGIVPLLEYATTPLVLKVSRRPLGSFWPSLSHGWSHGRRIRSAALGPFSLCFTDAARRGLVMD
jgi:hypothetical protein